jgi:glycerophosphoryl diester phosphodiesterase
LTAIYGHRGARGERPENTIEAFRYAGSLGIAGIECDVALTSDLVPVVYHDPELGNGVLIRDLSFAQLNQLAPDVPALSAALRAVPDTGLLIEIKTFPDAAWKSFPPEVVALAVVAVLRAENMLGRASIMAFDWRVLAAVAELEPAQRRVCLTAPDTEAKRALWWGEGVAAAATPPSTPGAVARSGASGWGAFHATLSAPLIAEAHALGLQVFAWTVNARQDFERLAPLVDGMITDFPSTFHR